MQRNGVGGEWGALDARADEMEWRLTFVARHFRDADFRQTASHALRIAFQRPDGIRRGERIEIALADRAHDRLEFLRRDFLEPVRKMASDDREILRIRTERLI